MRIRLNGWQRLWVLLSILYITAILAETMRLGFSSLPGDSPMTDFFILLGVTTIPIMGLYATGLTVAWIISAFQELGFQNRTPWKRLWIAGSVITLLCTSHFLYERVQSVLLVHQTFSAPPKAGDNVSFYVRNDDFGNQRVFVSVWGDSSSGWAELGPVITPNSQSILKESGHWNKNTRQWGISKDVAMSLVRQYNARILFLRVMVAIVLWLLPPVGVYVLTIGAVWVYEGFRMRGKATSV